MLKELRGEQRRTAKSRGEAFMLRHHDPAERISGLVIIVHKELGLGCSSNVLRLKDGLPRRVRTRPGGEAAQQ